MATIDVNAAIAARNEAISRAHAVLASANTERERADALVAEAEARLAFEAVCERVDGARTDLIAARVAIGEWSVEQACAVIEGSGYERSALSEALSVVLPVPQWIEAFADTAQSEWLTLIDRCVERDDRDGALRVYEACVCRAEEFDWNLCAATRAIVRAWGRGALAPFAAPLSDFAGEMRSSDAPEQDELDRGSDASGMRAAWALTQDDATLDRARAALIAGLDALCESDPYTDFGRFDPRAAIVELFIATGELVAALRLFERIIQWPDAEGTDRGYRAFFAVHELLPSFARTLVAEELSRVESLIFQRWIERAHPSQQRAWLPVLRTGARDKTLALLEANSTQRIEGSLASLPPSVRAPQVQWMLDDLRDRDEARTFVRTMDQRGPLYALLVEGPAQRHRARDDGTAPEEQALDLVLAFARDGHEAALSALEDWDALSAVARTFAWYDGLPARTIRARIDRARTARPALNTYDPRFSLLATGSDAARERWSHALSLAYPTRAEEFARSLCKRDDAIESAIRTLDRLATSDRWPDSFTVQLARGEPAARRAMEALLRRWLDAMESNNPALPGDGEQSGAHLLSCAAPAQLERAAALPDVRASNLLTHGVLVGAIRAERERSMDLRALRERVASAFEGAYDEPWPAWVRARFGLQNDGRGAITEAPIEEAGGIPAFADDCAALGIVDEVIDESARRDIGTYIQVCNALLPLASEPRRERAIPLFIDALTSVERPWFSDACAAIMPLDALCARWPRLGHVELLQVFNAGLVRRLGGQDAIDRIGDRVIARWVEAG